MRHLTQKQLHSLLGAALPPRERAALLEHVLACEGCAAALYRANAELPAVAPPKGMERRILSAARERPSHEKPRQESLRAYSLRVLAAMAAALVLLFTGTFQKLAELDLPGISQSIRTQITQFIDSTKEGLTLAPKPK